MVSLCLYSLSSICLFGATCYILHFVSNVESGGIVTVQLSQYRSIIHVLRDALLNLNITVVLRRFLTRTASTVTDNDHVVTLILFFHLLYC